MHGVKRTVHGNYQRAQRKLTSSAFASVRSAHLRPSGAISSSLRRTSPSCRLRSSPAPLRRSIAHPAASESSEAGATAPSSEPRREVYCSDLYNLTEAIADANSQDAREFIEAEIPSPSQAVRSSAVIAGSRADAQQQQAPVARDAARYYSGMITTGITQDNGASSADMLARSLQLAGGVAGLLALLTFAFLAGNGLV